MQDASYLQKAHTNPMLEKEGSKQHRAGLTGNQPPVAPEINT